MNIYKINLGKIGNNNYQVWVHMKLFVRGDDKAGIFASEIENKTRCINSVLKELNMYRNEYTLALEKFNKLLPLL